MSLLHKLYEGKRAFFWICYVGAYAADQATKWLWWSHPTAGRADITVIPGLLNFVSHRGNLRGALGLGPRAPAFYAVAAGVALVVLTVFFLTTAPGHGLGHAGLGLLVGGAVGNLMDRIFLGFVRDFIDLHWGLRFHWHTFNIADSAICLGFLFVLLDALFLQQKAAESGQEAAAP